ncbi:MAG: hypothetical protein ACPG5V_13680 [Vibrio cyclitrophicus]
MKHKHYEMIVAKAANMDLVVLFKASNGYKNWIEAENDLMPSFHPNTEYFLCLPQHKETCLHWLNGGEVQYRIALDVWTDASNNVSNAAWSSDNLLMDDQVEFRIKPKKEKRWIGVNSSGYATPMTFINEDECKNYISISYQPESAPKWQCIEIEVEV